MMRALALSLLGFPAQADTVNCELVDGMPLSFVIDRNQFVTAVSPEEPIRRKVTVVRMGDDTLPAEPFLIGDMRGFTPRARATARSCLSCTRMARHS